MPLRNAARTLFAGPNRRAPAGGEIISSASPKLAPLSLQEAADSTAQRRVWLLSGPLDADTVRGFDRRVRRHLPGQGGQLVFDLAAVPTIDSAGTAALVDVWRAGQQGSFDVELRHTQPAVETWLSLYEVPVTPPPIASHSVGAFEQLGGSVAGDIGALTSFTVLAADVSVSAVYALLRPTKLRWSALIQQASLMGSQAFGIVGLITFLVGLTLAFQSAYQLRQFGAAIYVATLTAISMVREMGPLITAIIVAGRSGASITSEVATMKVGEEIDAMTVMGISFIDYVAVPKLIAIVLTVPLLTLLADVLGILGGWVVGTVYLDIAPQPYLKATLDALVLKDLGTGLFKSAVFAWGIALIGLYHGIGVRGGAQEVGRATTQSVVSAIFFIIIADSAFSILFYVVLG